MMKIALIAASAAATAVMKNDIRDAASYLAGGGWTELKKELRPGNWPSIFFQFAGGVPLELCGGTPAYSPGDILREEVQVAA